VDAIRSGLSAGGRVQRLFRQANGDRWALTPEVFGAALEVGLRRAFSERQPSDREIERYLESLHAGDLALACACTLGHEGAWEHFVREYRPVLHRAADALEPGGGARELADALYADLFGLSEADGERRSLLRYFHGRSSLATWLRAVLAQRYVDKLRSHRRIEPLPEGEHEAAAPVVAPLPPDPDRPRLLTLILGALQASIDRLSNRDRMRLRSYYVLELTLARIGALTGEHEATVSRHLTRTRKALRDEVEHRLRDEAGLTEAEIERSFELALEDPAGFDLARVIDWAEPRKDPRPDRSS
jgi:RNA polymerase sigma-70 factor, ECF subfamily